MSAPSLGGSLVTEREHAPITPWAALWPRLLRHTGTFALEVWVDRSDRIVPAFQDQRDVVRALRRVGGVDVHYAPHGPRFLPAVSDSAKPVLVLGDLGRYGHPETQRRWRAAGESLRAAGREAFALVPCDAPFDGGPWQVLPWGDDPSAGDNPEALLDMSAPAEFVQPGLLRTLRQECTALGVGAEMRAWNHPDVVGRGSAGMVLRAHARHERRRRAMLRCSWVLDIITAWHADALSETRYLQAVAWHALGYEVPPEADLDDARAWVLGMPECAAEDPAAWRGFINTLRDRLPAAAFEDGAVGEALRALEALAKDAK